jgi:hypothetical protein
MITGNENIFDSYSYPPLKALNFDSPTPLFSSANFYLPNLFILYQSRTTTAAYFYGILFMLSIPCLSRTLSLERKLFTPSFFVRCIAFLKMPHF